MAILFALLAGGWWRIRGLRAAALAEPASRWNDAGRRMAQRLGLSRALRIVDSDIVDSPTVIGWLRPVVVLPIAALANLTPGQVEAILAHELAHVRRHDFLANVLQTMAETLLFYHPAVWWLSRRIRIEREHCCDDIAVEVCGDAYAYAAALTEIAAVAVSRPPFALAATGGSLVHRVRRILGVQAGGHRSPTSAAIVVGLALTLVVAAGGMRLLSQPAEPGPATPSRVGPADVNRLLGFQLLPGRARYPGDDPQDTRAWGATIDYPAGELALIGFTARSLIRDAYSLADVPIAGAPGWMDAETFDVTIPSNDAVASNGASDPDAVREAVRLFFENQLSLSWHFETREFPVYALVMANADGTLGPNIRPAAWCTFLCGVDNSLTRIFGKKVTLDELARDMPRTSPLSLGRDIVNRTGLTEAYDFELTLGPLPLAALAHHSPAAGALLYPAGIRSIFTALPQQLGLRLEESSEARRVLVIDHIDRPPSTKYPYVGPAVAGPKRNGERPHEDIRVSRRRRNDRGTAAPVPDPTEARIGTRTCNNGRHRARRASNRKIEPRHTAALRHRATNSHCRTASVCRDRRIAL